MDYRYIFKLVVGSILGICLGLLKIIGYIGIIVAVAGYIVLILIYKLYFKENISIKNIFEGFFEYIGLVLTLWTFTYNLG